MARRINQSSSLDTKKEELKLSERRVDLFFEKEEKSLR